MLDLHILTSPFTLVIIAHVSTATYPNIVYVFVDDLGWNDIGYQGTESATLTPNIDSLAATGVKLTNYYVQPTCSPSRTAFLTGQYPYKIGVLEPFGPSEPACMPDVTLLPESLETLGYINHLVGKWHLGFCATWCLPTSRGFSEFYGFYNGAQDYYTHSVARGYDWHLDNSTGEYQMYDEEGQYAVTLLDAKVRDIIVNHDTSTPMFLYYAMQSVHTPIQPLDADLADFSAVTDETRQNFLAMVKGVDDSIGLLVTALDDAGIKDNTIIIFSSDNGGSNDDGANNWPLSGSKGGLFEGGIKAGAFVAGYGLTQTGTEINGLMHAIDWFPTLISAIGGSIPSGLDGVDQWSMLSNGGASGRTEIVHGIDTTSSTPRAKGAIRKGDLKLISATSGKTHERIAPPESDVANETTGLSTDGVQLYDISNAACHMIRDLPCGKRGTRGMINYLATDRDIAERRAAVDNLSDNM